MSRLVRIYVAAEEIAKKIKHFLNCVLIVLTELLLQPYAADPLLLSRG